MPTTRKSVAIGAAAVVLAGLAGFAAAGMQKAHVMEVRLPDGSSARVSYLGDVPPKVTIGDPAEPPPALVAFDPASPFMEMERISAAMDRQAEAMLQGADAPLWPDAGPRLSVASAPAGPRVCGRSVEYSWTAGRQHQVVTRTFGDCASREPTAGAVKPRSTAPASDHPKQQAI